jgi:UDP-N-acetylglucosamine 2-epimerase (non-hydrolysing)
MKAAPIYKKLLSHRHEVKHIICHTGQHYDEKMSQVFFKELDLPKPDFYLGVGSGSHAEQTARVMVEFEKVVLEEKPSLILVYGDVNSTVACSLVASKLNIKIAHVESGLRSHDRTMPEEINRIITDTLSDYLFVTEASGIENLLHEGVKKEKIHFVGNVMIDSLLQYLPKVASSSILRTLGITKDEFILVTLHRPSNVDSKNNLKTILNTLNSISQKYPVVFPMHPRTKKNIAEFELNSLLSKNIIRTDPLGYIDFLALMNSAKLVITDSGGIQEECTFLKVQCLTARENTERPITVEVGTNHLLGTDWKKIQDRAEEILNGIMKKGSIPELWDGQASERIVKILLSSLN